MKIEWDAKSEADWTKDEKEKFIKKFEEKTWPDFHQLLDKQLVNSLGVNLYETLTKNTNTRIDFEVHPGGNIHICVFPWVCVHRPETINDAWGKEGDRKSPWLIGWYRK